MARRDIASARRHWRATLAGLALVSVFSMAIPTAAFGLACHTQKSYFMGTIEDHGATRGAEAKIDYVNESLCTGIDGAHPGTFSSYWVSVVGYSPLDVNADDIYQIGVDECKGTSCGPTSPSGTPYYFWAYGHHASSQCGPEVGPIPHLISGTPSGLRTYTVVPEDGPSGTLTHLNIDGVSKWFQPESTLTSCWAGIGGVQIMNESFDTGTQAGGPTSNYQDFQNPKWYDGSWHTISRAPSTTCDVPPSMSRGCVWSTVTPNTWKSWDTRF